MILKNQLWIIFVSGPMVASVRLDGDLFARSQSCNNQASFEYQNQNNAVINTNNHHR